MKQQEITNCNACHLFIKAALFLDINWDKDHDKANLKAYQSWIRKLIYSVCGIKPDILFIVRQFEWHNSDPQIDYMKIAKQVVS